MTGPSFTDAGRESRQPVSQSSSDAVGKGTASRTGSTACPTPARPDLSAVNRRDVLWIGDEPPAGLRRDCETSRFTLVPVSPDVRDLCRAAPTACAVVLELGAAAAAAVDGGGGDWVGPLIAAARRHGLLVVVTHGLTMPPQAYYDAAANLNEPDLIQPRIVAAYRDWLEIVRRCDAHDPGPGENVALRIEGDLPAGDEFRLLLCRAFHDVDVVYVECVTGGKSGAAVLVVTVAGEHARNRPLPFLVKVNGIAKIREEHRKMLDYARRLMPRRYRPDVHVCVHGENLAVLVQDFEDGVQLLGDLVQRGTNAGVYIPAIFSTALRNFHSSGALVDGSLSRPFRDLKALRWESAALVDAAVAARANNAHIPDVVALRAAIDGLPIARYRDGLVHGDLHAANVFACQASHEIIVIDFGNVMKGPVVADAACLEASLAFRSRDLVAEAEGRQKAPRPLDADWLRAAYAYPLDPGQVDSGPRLVGAAGRGRAALADALRAIRSAARERDDSRPTYAVAVASYLLRYASFDDHAELKERALAYEVACSLVRDADRDLRRALGVGDVNGVAA